MWQGSAGRFLLARWRNFMRNRHPNCQLADIISAFHKDIPTIASNTWKARTLYALMRCRTAEMGGHIDRCDNPDCNKLHLSYNSCRNRHCLPKHRDQGHLRERWIQNREKDLLNASYFHSLSRPSGSCSPCLIHLMNSHWSNLQCSISCFSEPHGQSSGTLLPTPSC